MTFQFPQLPNASCEGQSPAVQRYVGDTWMFLYTFFQPKLDANGNAILDANGQLVPDPANPVILTGSVLTGMLYFGASVIATLACSTDADTNLAIGKFKLIAPPSVTSSARPDSYRIDPFAPEGYPTRLAVILTDALGSITTLAVQPIAVVAR